MRIMSFSFCIMTIVSLFIFAGSVLAEELWWKNGDWVIDKTEKDYDGDGDIDQFVSYIHGANGFTAKREIINDGIIDRFFMDTYDNKGDLILSEVYGDADKITDFYDRSYVHIYDSHGNKIEFRDAGDYYRDGTFETDFVHSYSFIYDDSGNITSHEGDFGNDGVIDYSSTHIYNSDGKMASYTFSDGIVEYEYTNTYNSNGFRSKSEGDFDDDGVIDSITTYTYDNFGNLTKEETDSDNDGSIDSSITSTFDENGNLIQLEVDSDGNGIADELYIYTWKSLSSDSSSSGGCFINSLF